MLRTALTPKWILSFLFAMFVAAIFIVLGNWQLQRSLPGKPEEHNINISSTIFALDDVIKPQTPMLSNDISQLVTVRGYYDEQRQIIVGGRVQGNSVGYWIVTAFVVEGVEDVLGENVVIPVARAWVSEVVNMDFLGISAESRDVLGILAPTEAPRAVEGKIFDSLSVAQLVNLWDTSSYSGFVIAFLEGDIVDGMEQIEWESLFSEQNHNWLNIFYALEWAFFAGCAFFLWWRLVADDYNSKQLLVKDSDEEV